MGSHDSNMGVGGCSCALRGRVWEVNPQVAQGPLSMEGHSEAAEVQSEGEQVHPWVCVDAPHSAPCLSH